MNQVCVLLWAYTQKCLSGELVLFEEKMSAFKWSDYLTHLYKPTQTAKT